MTRFATPDTNPVHRLLMLAPANFGSPLAHKGRSFMGRIVKGFKSNKPFQTGTFILKGLELGSPFTWDLALRDRFSKQLWYGPGKVLCTVLVGTRGYTGISAAANEDGTDGTVRVSTANLNPVRVVMDFVKDPQKPTIELIKPKGITAFARIPGDNHSTIALKDKGPKNRETLVKIKGALTVTDETFPSWVKELDDFSSQALAGESDKTYTQGYQNTVVCLKDDLGAYITDYFMEVFVKKQGQNRQDETLTAAVQEDVFSKVHTYGDNPALRSILINTTMLEEKIGKQDRPIHISFTAMPDIRKTGTVGYSTFGYEDIGSIKLTPAEQKMFFSADRTIFLDVKIRREQADAVFQFRKMS